MVDSFMSNHIYNGWYYAEPNEDLTQEEKEYNANLMMKFLRKNGFTKFAAAGAVGNAWAESQMNPGRWQDDTEWSGGYGLMQWTPYTKYSEWAGADWQNNGPLECERLIYEREQGLQFYPSTQYPQWTYRRYCTIEPEEGLTINETINMCAEIWVYNYLRPGDPTASLANRKYHARYVYQHCPGNIIPYWLLMKWSNMNRGIIYGR